MPDPMLCPVCKKNVVVRHGSACAACSMTALRAYGWIGDDRCGPYLRQRRGPTDPAACKALGIPPDPDRRGS
jgi:hypothetical protein